MIELLTSIPGPTFLGIFWITALISLFCGWLLTWVDSSSDYATSSLPSPNEFDVITIAALQGPDNVIRMVAFDLWQKGLITIRNNQIESVASIYQKVGSTIHQAIYDSAKTPLTSRSLLRNSTLQQTLDTELAPIYEKLHRRHLLRTFTDRLFAWLYFIIPITIIWGLGGSKLLLGISHGRPVGYLVISLMIVSIATVFVVNPFQIEKETGCGILVSAIFILLSGFITLFLALSLNIIALIPGLFFLLFIAFFCITVYRHIYDAVEPSNLGLKYLKSLQKNFAWLRTSLQQEKEFDSTVDATLGFAIFGNAILTGAAFADYRQVFGPTTSSGGDSGISGGDSGGGCGGGCSGGGCGGCGGGSD